MSYINAYEKMFDYFVEKDWEKYIDLVSLNSDLYSYAFSKSMYDYIPDHLKRDLALSVYTHHGYRWPEVRRAVRGLLKYGPPELPPEIAQKDVITIYRGGSANLEKAKYRISWTTDREKAIWFMNRRRALSGYDKPGTYYAFQAKIKTDKIIAYYNEREENEIIQYRSAFDIVEIDRIEVF